MAPFIGCFIIHVFIESKNKSTIFNAKPGVRLNSLFARVPETSRLYPWVICTEPR